LFNTDGTAEKQNQIQKDGETQQLLPAIFFNLTKKDQKKIQKMNKKISGRRGNPSGARQRRAGALSIKRLELTRK